MKSNISQDNKQNKNINAFVDGILHEILDTNFLRKISNNFSDNCTFDEFCDSMKSLLIQETVIGSRDANQQIDHRKARWIQNMAYKFDHIANQSMNSIISDLSRVQLLQDGAMNHDTYKSMISTMFDCVKGIEIGSEALLFMKNNHDRSISR